jgi:hypothetical protein
MPFHELEGKIDDKVMTKSGNSMVQFSISSKEDEYVYNLNIQFENIDNEFHDNHIQSCSMKDEKSK